MCKSGINKSKVNLLLLLSIINLFCFLLICCLAKSRESESTTAMEESSRLKDSISSGSWTMIFLLGVWEPRRRSEGGGVMTGQDLGRSAVCRNRICCLGEGDLDWVVMTELLVLVVGEKQTEEFEPVEAVEVDEVIDEVDPFRP
jgi:hypothetical protein